MTLDDIAAWMSAPGALFGIDRTDGPHLKGVRVLPGEACLMVEEAAKRIMAQTGWVPQDWENPFPPPEEDPTPTLPTAFPAAPAAPEICPEEYYGISCTHAACRKSHRLPRRA